MKLEIDYSKDKLLTDFSKKTLQDRYLVGDEQSPQEAFARAASAFADDQDHAQRIYDYLPGAHSRCLQFNTAPTPSASVLGGASEFGRLCHPPHTTHHT